jgi:hypothetical protein
MLDDLISSTLASGDGSLVDDNQSRLSRVQLQADHVEHQSESAASSAAAFDAFPVLNEDIAGWTTRAFASLGEEGVISEPEEASAARRSLLLLDLLLLVLPVIDGVLTSTPALLVNELAPTRPKALEALTLLSFIDSPGSSRAALRGKRSFTEVQGEPWLAAH